MLTEEDLQYYTTCNILDVLSEADIERLIESYRTLQKQNKQLIAEKEQLQGSFQITNDSYKALNNIIERARKLAFIREEEEAEENSRVRFKMDANGNLTRIDGDKNDN